MVNIQFASMPGARSAPAARPASRPAEPAPRIEPPKPVIREPQPETPKARAPEKETVPMSPFGRSTKKGSENPDSRPATVTPPAGAPGGTAAADVPIGGSGVAGLEGGDFPYALYISGMQRRIGTNWFRPAVPAGTSVVVYYRIQRDGTITDARVETPSGNPTFDRAALSAVRSSSPLNPLPFAYSGSYLGVHLIFR
jgi:TonB family protein